MVITLKAARVNAGYTIAEAAKLIGVSSPTLRKYENYETAPKAKYIPAIESVYGVSRADVIFYPEGRV